MFGKSNPITDYIKLMILKTISMESYPIPFGNCWNKTKARSERERKNIPEDTKILIISHFNLTTIKYHVIGIINNNLSLHSLFPSKSFCSFELWPYSFDGTQTTTTTTTKQKNKKCCRINLCFQPNLYIVSLAIRRRKKQFFFILFFFSLHQRTYNK